MLKKSTESLGKYVERIMKEKNLKPEEIQRRSGGAITEGYVRSIVAEKAANLSVGKLKALAQGLDASEEDVFKVARGLSLENGEGEEGEIEFCGIISLAHAATTNRTLRQLLLEASKLSPRALKEAVMLLRMLNAENNAPARKSKSG